MRENIDSYKQLRVYQNAMNSAMDIYHLSKEFPREERYSLTDQVRRSSRSVCANIAEAWRKRRYQAAFIAKLSDALSEASETQVWIDFSLRCGYVGTSVADRLDQHYNVILSQLVVMTQKSSDWLIS